MAFQLGEDDEVEVIFSNVDAFFSGARWGSHEGVLVSPRESGPLESDIRNDILLATGQLEQTHGGHSLSNSLRRREMGLSAAPRKSIRPASVAHRLLPSGPAKLVAEPFRDTLFCGQFSADGDRFVSACKDCHIRIFRADTWEEERDIEADDIMWSVLDTACSADGRWMVYTTWSTNIKLVNLSPGYEEEPQQVLSIGRAMETTAIFAVRFSQSSSELIASTSSFNVAVCDLDTLRCTLKFRAHDNDVNSVEFLDESSALFCSGSDDGLIKVWDRRCLHGNQPKPAGVFVGHLSGITHMNSKGDGRYLISNSKDQTIKLWDVRKMVEPASALMPPRSSWDYRQGIYWVSRERHLFDGSKTHKQDVSLMTYRGHDVARTLIRSYFSPAHSTGQRYIYSGSCSGKITIYDVVSGDVVKTLRGHRAPVRDLSWHPHAPEIVSSSWDGTIRSWKYTDEPDMDEPQLDTDSSEEEW